MAAYKSKRSMLQLFLMMASLFHSASAATHIVGGPAGWAIQQDLNFYDDWALNENFVVGDKLAFVSTTTHNVYEVSSIDADNCDATNPLAIYVSASPTVTLSTAGTHSFICEVPGHCVLGMKMVVDVVTVPRLTNATTPPASISTLKGPIAAPAFSPPAPPPSAAFGLRSGPAFVVAGALVVISQWIM